MMFAVILQAFVKKHRKTMVIRNEIKCLFDRLKDFRRMFSHFEKLDIMFKAFPNFTLIFEMLCVNTT